MDKCAEIQAFNDTFVEQVKCGNEKDASASLSSYVRNKLREVSFTEKILTPIDVTNDDLHPAQDPELLVRWVDREPDTAPAVTVPYGTAPDGFEFKGDRVPVYFSRIMTPMMQKDVDKLRGYTYDIRGVLADIQVKDVATEIDTRFINACNTAVGTINTNNAANGLSLPQYVGISGGVTRDNLIAAFKVMMRLRVPFGPMQADGSEVAGCILANNVTASDLLAFNRSEAGGDLSEQQWKTGKPFPTVLGVPLITTIKRDLVPDNVIYLYSSEEYFGKYLRLQELTAFMKNEAFFLNFFHYLSLGISILSTKGVCKIDFS